MEDHRDDEGQQMSTLNLSAPSEGSRKTKERAQEFSFDFGARAVAMPHGVRLHWPLKRAEPAAFSPLSS